MLARVLVLSSRTGAQAPAVSFAVSTSTRTFHYPDRLAATLLVRITTGAQAQDLFFRPAAAAWPDPAVAGQPISFGKQRLEGPGAFGLSEYVAVDYAWPACLRGGESGGVVSFEVKVPANATTTLVLPVTAFGPRWPGTRYTPQLSVSSAQGVSQILRVPKLTMTGRSGVHIRLRIPGRPTSP